MSAVKEYLGSGFASCLTSKDTTPKYRKILENSYKITKKYSSEKIGTEHLLLAILEEKECVATKILTKIVLFSFVLLNKLCELVLRNEAQRHINEGIILHKSNHRNTLNPKL